MRTKKPLPFPFTVYAVDFAVILSSAKDLVFRLPTPDFRFTAPLTTESTELHRENLVFVRTKDQIKTQIFFTTESTELHRENLSL